MAFGPKARAIGEAAKTQETANFRNTIGSLKRLVGRTLSDPDIQNVESKFINATLVDAAGTVGAQVRLSSLQSKKIPSHLIPIPSRSIISASSVFSPQPSL